MVQGTTTVIKAIFSDLWRDLFPFGYRWSLICVGASREIYFCDGDVYISLSAR